VDATEVWLDPTVLITEHITESSQQSRTPTCSPVTMWIASWDAFSRAHEVNSPRQLPLTSPWLETPHTGWRTTDGQSAFLSLPSSNPALYSTYRPCPRSELSQDIKRSRGFNDGFERYPRVDCPGSEGREDRGQPGRSTTATKQVEIGRLGSAARTLGGISAVATVTESMVKAL
jgi:hypothetical protein